MIIYDPIPTIQQAFGASTKSMYFSQYQITKMSIYFMSFESIYKIVNLLSFIFSET